MADALKFPAPLPEDAEDVSWALSTAEAMFARGDVVEALKWIRRAAEAASEVDADERALEFAKAAADLSSLASTSSGHSSQNMLTRTLLTPPNALPQSIRNAQAQAFRAQQEEYEVREPKTEPPPPSMPLQRVSTKREVPLPSKGRAPRPPSVPAPAMPHSVRGGVLPPRRRRSQANLEEAARKAAAIGEVPGTMRAGEAPMGASAAIAHRHAGHRSADDDSVVPTAPATSVDSREPGSVESRRPRRKSVPDREKARLILTTTDEWDAQPTQNLTGDELSSITNEGALTSEGAEAPMSAPVPTPLVQLPAIRVMLWKDADGVHVAPAGGGAPPRAVDALIVALDPATDLAAWLEEERGEKPKRTRRS